MTKPLIPLKPCPFCGSKDIELVAYASSQRFYVFCNNCDACGPSDLGNSGACEAWNTRPVEAQLLEACKAAVKFLAPVIPEDWHEMFDIYDGLKAAIAAAEGEP